MAESIREMAERIEEVVERTKEAVERTKEVVERVTEVAGVEPRAMEVKTLTCCRSLPFRSEWSRDELRMDEPVGGWRHAIKEVPHVECLD